MTQGCAHHYADYMGRSIEQSRVKKVPLGSKCAIPSCRGTIPYRTLVTEPDWWRISCNSWSWMTFLNQAEYDAAPWLHLPEKQKELTALTLKKLHEASALCTKKYVDPVFGEAKICDGKVSQITGNGGKDGPCRGPYDEKQPAGWSQYYILWQCSDNGGTPCST
jgi:hypothetical protein